MTYHNPGIFTDAFDTFLVEEVKPPLGMLIHPTFFIIFHIDILTIFALRVGKRPALESVGQKQTPECLSRLQAYDKVSCIEYDSIK